MSIFLSKHPVRDFDLRHDPWQMEDFSGEVSHVAVEEDKQRLDDTSVRGETGSKGTQDTVDGSHHDASQWNHEETGDAEEGITYSHSFVVWKLLKQVIQNLQREKKRKTFSFIIGTLVL